MCWKNYLAGLAIGLIGTGCRTATSVQELPRVDLQLQNTGNRGYLAGAPPAEPELKPTRQMFGLMVEVPTFGKPKPDQMQGAEDVAPPEVDMQEPESPEASGPYDTYVVQKNESLWSIAAKSEIYGRATQWRRIFDANRDLLKNPGQLKAGMTLRIPRGEGEPPASYGKDAGSRK